MAKYSEIDQYTKDEGTLARIRVAMRTWAIARLSGSTRDADDGTTQDALSKELLRSRNGSSTERTLAQTMLAMSNFPTAAIADTETGDATLQSKVDTLLPVMLSRGVVSVIDGDTV